MRRNLLLLLFLFVFGLTTGWSQSRGVVTITAIPETICVGESAQLHAETTSDFLIDFETGDFSQFDFQNNSNNQNRPWIVEIAQTMDGSVYCMKSGNQGIANSISSISATFNFTNNGSIRFDAKCMGEGSYTFWDACTFMIDGEIEFTNGAQDPNWKNHGYNVSSGSHTFTWSYSKDGSVNPTGDAFFVDNIIFSHTPIDDGEQQTFTFENHTLQGWTTIDADGDGFNWGLGTEMIINEYGYVGFTGHNGSSDIVASQSYNKVSEDYGYPLFPDNYLVSPSKIAVKEGAFISFWACAQDYLWAGEHFGVAVSTGSNTNASNFTTIMQWTMNAKSTEKATGVTRSDSKYMGTWYKYTVDLSAYENQSIWIAIRHFDCTDMFYLDVDDIMIFEGSSSDPGGGDDDIIYQWDNGMTGPNITVWPSETTTYTVTAYQNGQSVGSAQKTIMVYSDPNLTLTTNTGESSICVGDSITIYAMLPALDVILAGDILCTDGSIVRFPQFASSGKTAMGVVFYVDATGQHGWAVSLSDIQMNKKWSSENVAVPGLLTYSHWMDAVADIDGYSNTQRIRSYGNETKYPAAWAVDFDNGWYLPAIGQLSVLFGSLNAVNNSLNEVGTPISYTSGSEIWSSTASSNSQYAMMIIPQYERIIFDKKSVSHKVRAVINF